MRSPQSSERVDTIVVGGGQAGLAVGYHLARRGVPFLILDANERIGGAWRSRWDSLRLFTPARYDSLPGMPFPSSKYYFPTKDEMADYLAAYAARFNLPVRSGTTVQRLAKRGNRFVLQADDREFETENVVVAMSNYQKPVTPPFAGQLHPDIVQMHSVDYRRPSQLRDGDVLIVGAANSGAEIATELSKTRRTWLSGRHVGNLPFEYDGTAARLFLTPLLLRGVFHHVLTVGTPIGRKLRPKMLNHAAPLIRVKPKRLAAAGVRHVARVAGVQNGKPLLTDGTVLDVANVIWCTGFDPGFSWIDLPVMDGAEPRHESGVVTQMPGLYFVGLQFLHAFSSIMIHGVGRDAERIANAVADNGRRSSRSVRDAAEPHALAAG
jgi:putative flavoprotein involved in K+ transport